MVIKILIFILFISVIWFGFSYFPCPNSLSWMVEMDNPISSINRAITIIENSNIQPRMTVLDIGCGPGRLTLPIAQAVTKDGSVIALDLQQGMIDKVRARANSKNLTNIAYICSPIEQAELEEDSFDRVFLVTVLGEIPNKKLALAKILKVLKSGGLLSVTEILADPHYQKMKDVKELAREVGFKELKIFKDWIAYTVLFEKSDCV